MKRKSIYDILIWIFAYVFVISLPSLFNLNELDKEMLTFALRLCFLIVLVVFGKAKERMFKPLNLWFLPIILLLPFSNYFYLLFCSNITFDFSNKFFFYIFDCFIIASIEEILFRSFTLNGLETKKDKMIWWIASSLMFGLLHFAAGFSLGTLAQVGYTFFLGLMLGALYLYGGGFIWCLLLHFVFNLFNDKLFECFSYTGEAHLYYVANVAVGMIIGIYLLLLLIFKFGIFNKENAPNASNAL